MYIHLDESGDLGYSDKSSKYFVIALLATKNHKPIDNCIKRIRQRKLKTKYKYIPELKFNNSNELIRRAILRCIAEKDVKIYYVLVDKEKLHKRRESIKSDFYIYLTGFLIQQILEINEDIELIVDKSLSKEKREEFDEYIRNKILDKLRLQVDVHVEHKDSREDKCIQAIDFVAGAIFSKYEFGNDSYYRVIQKKIGQEVIFHEEK